MTYRSAYTGAEIDSVVALKRQGGIIEGALVVRNQNLTNSTLTLSANSDVGRNGMVQLSTLDGVIRIGQRISGSDQISFVLGTEKQNLLSIARISLADSTGINKSGNYNIFGEHNKPSGSYIGTGETVSRSISIPSIGNFLSITKRNGDSIAIVSPAGAVCKNGGTAYGLENGAVSFSEMELTFSSDDPAINSLGATYLYQVL